MADAEHRISTAGEDLPGFTPETLNVHSELTAAPQPMTSWVFGGFRVQAHEGRDGFWIVVKRPELGGVALRTFPIMGAYTIMASEARDDGADWTIETNAGTWRVALRLIDDKVVRMTSKLTPRRDLLVVFWPRDLYPLDENDDPTEAQGEVEAGQRGLNTGLVYFRLNKPCACNVLYVQNLTSLNSFFTDTKTKPDGVVGGEWPELGYQPPAAPDGNSPPVNPLKAEKEYTISDALLAFRPDCHPGEVESMRIFVDMMADIYPHLDKSEPAMPDWFDRARRTLHDLTTCPNAQVEAMGRRYLHPYTASEYPDSMVHMSVLATLREYERVYGQSDPLSDELAEGTRAFYDDKQKTLRRYLPNVGVDKSPDAVDAWYLYHPLMNLGRLAMNGEDWARKLFFDALDFVIRVAQHFEYHFPIIYNLTDLSVVKQARDEAGLGQTDAGGLYAYVMLQAYDLTLDRRYLDEARAALKAIEGLGFELAYQTNLTAWGAVACLKLWKRLDDPKYLAYSVVFVASWLHNCELWQSELGYAKHYANFFGLTCLHDGPYMAAYEQFESFAAFDEYLQEGGDQIPASVRLLLSEYWRHSLDVLWGFYPDALPEDALAREVRNGHIDRNLSFPLEDLYGDGGPAGRIGQEIYGCGAAFVIAARAYAECPGTPFRIYADYPLKANCEDGKLEVRIFGPPGFPARLYILKKRDDAPAPRVLDHNGKRVAVGHNPLSLECDGTYVIRWDDAEGIC